MKTILIATKNKGKAKEFEALFYPKGYKVLTLLDMDDHLDVEETGKTFEENAKLKAETISSYYNLPVLADDSGLMVDALDGRPGIYSARYAGEEKNDESNLQKVLAELKDIPDDERTARFYCALAFAIPGEETRLYKGTIEGRITKEPKGSNGFGYDPIFYVPSKEKTMAELSADEKNEISHRAQAIRYLANDLDKIF
ncbi:XTP/dITP diphosphatase [Peribacillus tepidiphilus]|uniref:XTP/dITP diphosphatase n=1 Tax=Peribacillus tepidiphilus TaxID=2652445 RepID=UPI0035B553E9